MKTYNWYKIFNLGEFEEDDFVSDQFDVTLEAIGTKTILVSKGFHVCVLYDGVLFPLKFNDENPYVRDTQAVYVDAAQDVWIGIEVPA